MNKVSCTSSEMNTISIMNNVLESIKEELNKLKKYTIKIKEELIKNTRRID